MYKLYQKILSATLFFLLVSIMTYAQTKITGTVNETDGSSIPGATVVVKGTKIITSTNVDGKFAIEAPSDAVLTISFTGYQTLDVSVNGRSQITAVLSVASTTLSDVVVVGYGTQKKVNLSGAVNTVDTKNIVNRPVTSLTSALQGAVPGMAIKATPGDVGNDLGTINIRGRGNLGASEPLYVLDGVIVSAGDFARINSNDVASISVLKDASASAIYGSRAAFGVILVTTKKGKSGSMQLHYNSYYGIQSATVLPSWVGAYDYAVLRNEAAANTGKSAVFSADALSKIQNQTDPDRYPDNDWYALTLKESAPVMEHQLDISGGDKTRYYLSGAYFKQNSLVPGKDLERYSLRANTETEVSDKFKIGSNLSFVRDGFDNENGPLDFANLNRQTPLIVNKQSNGEWGSINGGSIDAPFAGRNPLRLLQNGGRDAYAQNRFLGTVTGTYTPIKGLDISGLISYNIYGVIRSTFLNTIDPILDFNTGMPIPSTAVTVNQLTERWQNTGRLLTQGTVSYESTIGEHYFKILGGASYENLNDRFTQTIRKNFASNDLNAINGGSADPLNTNATGNIQQRATESIFGRLNYSFKDRYLLEASLRYDASSQFAPGYRGGIYPSFSGAWRLSQEEFMKDVSWVRELKLRSSWGKLGNISNVGYNDFYDGLTTGTSLILDEKKQDGVFPAKLYNPQLSWEKVNMTNIGLDATLFQRLNLQLDVFNRITNDILLPSPSVPDESGLAAAQLPPVNLGKVGNKGFELSLNYNGQVNDFKYSIGGNVSKIWNKVLDLGGVKETPPSGYYINRIGESIGSFYMWESDGLFANSADVASHAFQSNSTKAGDIKYIDQNGDKKIDGDDRVIVGNDVPYFIYGLNISANYKNFDFSVLANGQRDVKVYLESEASQAFFNSSGAKSYVLGRWTTENPDPNAAYPRVLISGDNTQNLKQSDFWLFNADYFRFKAITLGYSLPQTVLTKLKIKGLRFYASSNNPFTVRADNRLGDFDPETPSQRASYPQLKTYSFGLNLTL